MENNETLEKHFDTYSSETSKIVRQLSFAFIAVIWIYRDTSKYEVLPYAFRTPLFLFILTLSLDLLQYLVASIITHIYERRATYPKGCSLIINLLFYTKTVILIWGGILFLTRMTSVLNLNN